jgi:hypothetical protein
MAAAMGLMGLLTACGAGVGQGQQNIDSSQPASSAAVDPAQSSPSSQPATPASAAAAEPVQNSGAPHDAVSTSSSSALGYALKMTDEDLGSASQWKSSYVLEATPTLFIALDVDRSISGYHTASIVVHTPQGLPYQHFDFTFTTAAPAGAEAPAIKGVLRAEHTPTGYRLWVAMPVANTLIQDLGLAGGWSSSVYVDRSIRPTASTSFTLVHAQE